MFGSPDLPPGSLWHKVGQLSAAEVPTSPSPSAGSQWGLRLLTSWNKQPIPLTFTIQATDGPWLVCIPYRVSKWTPAHVWVLPTHLVNTFQIWYHWVLWFCSCGYLTLNSTMTTTAELHFFIAIVLLLTQPQWHGAELCLASGPWPSHSAQPRVNRLLFHSLSRFILF